ncbi:MAG: DUF1800 domain-containing protein [Candidatus Dormibacteria bacterium]
MSRRSLVGGSVGLAGLAGALGIASLVNEATASRPDPRQQAAHLLRRAGFSPAPAEVDAAVRAGIRATTESLLHPEKVDDAALESRLAADNFDLTRVEQQRRWWVVRMAVTRRPLIEKMTLFWHGLLTSSVRKVGKDYVLMSTQNQFLRQHCLGNLRDLLVGISKDGAMLKWLDGTGSSKAHPNENYARELMELFTMGVGTYGETDVRELARALTGWYVDASGTVEYRLKAHDGGVKTFLGHTGPLGLEEAVDIILANPATPQHLATRMWEFFVSPGPSAADLKPVIDAYHASRYDIRAMMTALLTSPAFFEARAYRSLVKSPAELVAGVARQFAISLDVNAIRAMESMGPALFDPPNVAGWPGGPGWLSTGSWMARVRWLLSLSTGPIARTTSLEVAEGRFNEAVARAAATMVDGTLSAGARDAVAGHLRSVTPSRRPGELFFLLASSPEYQLA